MGILAISTGNVVSVAAAGSLEPQLNDTLHINRYTLSAPQKAIKAGVVDLLLPVFARSSAC